MGEQILKTNIKREVGYLYYTATANDGCLTVCKAKMARGGRKKK
jgi:hypothetical protein